MHDKNIHSLGNNLLVVVRVLLLSLETLEKHVFYVDVLWFFSSQVEAFEVKRE